VTAGYSGTPLARKLGIKPAARVLLSSAPRGFDLGPLDGPAVVQRRKTRDPYDVVLAFCRDTRSLDRAFADLTPHTTVAGALWIAWPKKSSGVATDLDENVVRNRGLSTGLVDVKVCAVDATWSGLKFVRRVRDR
jgi:hypothetical protein